MSIWGRRVDEWCDRTTGREPTTKVQADHMALLGVLMVAVVLTVAVLAYLLIKAGR
jgi:hypothetical protein